MIDLHVHSTASDGTCTPEELAARGKSFRLMALTDHDTVDGIERFLAAASTFHPKCGTFLGGIELSVAPGELGERFHLLGIGINPKAPTLLNFLERIRAGRTARNAVILKNLQGLGIPIEESDVRQYANGKIVARPHFARVLVEKGFAQDVKDAFARYLIRGRPGYAPRYRPPAQEAFEVIHAAGGIAVMAHPKYFSQDEAALKAALKNFKDCGLDAIEAIYQANTNEETILHLRLAKELDLPITAGSDFHGANKPTIPLGISTPLEDSIIERFSAYQKATFISSPL